MTGFEFFERLADAGARLLRVERLGARPDDGAARAFLLTFDVGRILVSSEPAGGPLAALHLASPDDAPSGLEPADEDEPWWRLLGAPVTHAEAPESERAAVELQFRSESENPRRVRIESDPRGVRARLGPVH